ncbi:MAG: Kelch repeat-containing protein, partial [bacterium]
MRFGVLVPILLTGCLVSASAAGWTVAYQGQKGKLGMAPYCKPVLLPDGRLFVWSPLFPSVLDLEKGTWTRLVPEGKEPWRETLPEVRRRGTRWGNDLSFHEVEGVAYPIWMTHFNQLCYVPPLKKVLFFVGGRTFAFDLTARRWQPLEPETSPPHVVWSAMIYDPVNEEVVLFGGGAQCDENRPGTWLFDPKAMNWRKLEQPLADQPPPRCNAPLVYDPKNRRMVVFGGDAQDRYLADTWVYDCAKRRWHELRTNVRPFPRGLVVLCPLGRSGRILMGGRVPGVPQPPGRSHRSRGEFGAETWALDPAKATWTRVRGSFPLTYWETAAYDAANERVLLCRATSRYRNHSTFQVLAARPDLTPADEKGTLDPGRPIYKYHPPEWYEEDVPPADPNAGETLFASLEPNTWTPVTPPKNAMMRTWGSATIDTDRHEVIYWGGGHCGYCGTDVSHFSLRTLRWSSSYPPEFPAAPYNGFY